MGYLFTEGIFFQRYEISTINIFEEPVFSDTSYSVCSFLFKKKNSLSNRTTVYLYPTQKVFTTNFNDNINYTFGCIDLGIFKNNNFSISRITKLNFFSKCSTQILIQCIDNKIRKINASIVKKDLIFIDNTPKLSARSYVSLLIEPKISLVIQRKLVLRFNTFLNRNRKLFFSLFLTQYRELSRKRISFKLIYDIFNYLLNNIIK